MDWNTERILVARRVLAERLTGISGDWAVVGDLVVGPGTLAVRVEDHHQRGEKHFDFGFVLNRSAPDEAVIWDCAVGLTLGSREEVVSAAVASWISCDFPVFLELLTGTGEHSENYHGDDPEGCPGWHVIHGGIMGINWGDSVDALQDWVLAHPLLPKIGESIASNLDPEMPHGVKVFFGSTKGSDIAEVRVDGVVDDRSTAILQSLDWPRFEDPTYVRCFLLFAHGE